MFCLQEGLKAEEMEVRHRGSWAWETIQAGLRRSYAGASRELCRRYKDV